MLYYIHLKNGSSDISLMENKMLLNLVKNYEVVNLTGHPISIFAGGEFFNFEPANKKCVVTKTEPHIIGEGILVRGKVSSIDGLPEPQDRTIFIVGALVGDAMSELNIKRNDIYMPGTSPDESPIRYTAEDAPTPKLVGLVKAVTMLAKA